MAYWAHEVLGVGVRAHCPALTPQMCYLCHSFLTLAGVVVSYQDISLDHWVRLSGAQPTVRNCTEGESEKEGSLGEPGLFLLPVSLEEFPRDTDLCPSP